MTDPTGALTRAATQTMARDAIWRDAPNPAPGCDHDYRCLPIVEWRQTVTCARCGGLNADLSRALTSNPRQYAVAKDGRVTRRDADA